MRVLLITSEEWNDTVHGNNVLSNWFNGFPATFAQVYASPGLPQNNCCRKYFHITDKMMINSILHGKKAGRVLTENDKYVPTGEKYNSTDVQGIGFLRKYCGDFLRTLEAIVWDIGRFDKERLGEFVLEFNPDIIFAPRFASSKMLRLEKTVLEYANCPIVAFTGDNEYSLRRFNFSPFFWINLLYERYRLRQMMKRYSLYYTLSAEQMAEYEKQFGIDIKLLRKCGDFTEKYIEKEINKPIKIVYAGKLYMNRWKTLAEIGMSLKKINSDSVKAVLQIYTMDTVTEAQEKQLHDNRNIFLKGAVSPEQLTEIYRNADIALHVESFELKHRYATRVSFSTKIIDCLASTCAVMAIAWKEHSGLTYLKHEDAAICIDSPKKIYDTLCNVCNHPELIRKYQKKAWECGIRNHRREAVRDMLYNDFVKLINNN